jgi:hypothetical protein
MQEAAVFELGERAAVLSSVEAPAIIPHMAEAEGKRLPPEVCTCFAPKAPMSDISHTTAGIDERRGHELAHAEADLPARVNSCFAQGGNMHGVEPQPGSE